MKVVLLNNIKGIGRIGDVKDISDGYARNFLLPRKLVRLATQGAVQEAETLKIKRLSEEKLASEEAAKAAEKLAGLTVELTAKASEQGTLFASIGKEEVLQKIRQTTGLPLNREAVCMDEHIKTAGEHEVHLHLTSDITATVRVVVTPAE